jgi:hypothetical protein
MSAAEERNASRREQLQALISQLDYLLPEIKAVDTVGAHTLAMTIHSLQLELGNLMSLNQRKTPRVR